MKITNLTLTLFVWKFPAHSGASGYGARGAGKTSLGLLTISTDEGIDGHAFLGSSVHSAEIDALGLVSHLKPLLIGQDPLMRSRLHEQMWHWRVSRLTSPRAIGAIDVALWDIAGKRAGMPVYQLLGGHRSRIPVYASSQVLRSIDEYVEQALHYRDLGWHGYKIHPVQDWRKDIEICTAVRDAVGKDFPLMLDSMWGYTYDQALRVGKALEHLNFLWFEDPLGEHDIYTYKKLRAKLDVPLLATEYPSTGLEGYASWITSQATDMLRGDVAVKGGLTTIVRAAHLAAAFNMPFEVHHGANSHANVANLHVELACPNCRMHEVMLPDEFQKFGLAPDLEVDEEGYISAPTVPGIGANIDFNLIDNNTINVMA